MSCEVVSYEVVWCHVVSCGKVWCHMRGGRMMSEVGMENDVWCTE